MDGDDDVKVGHPIQRKSHDLSKEPRRLKEKGKSVSIELSPARSDNRTPDDMMRQMGFDPSKYMNPLQFLLAVMNDDLEAIFKNENRRRRMEGKGGIAVSYRLEAAKTAARYTNQELPKITVTKDDSGFGESLSDAISQGHERVRTRRMIIEEVERISPQIPLAPASYPPALEDVIDQVQDEDDMAEGDTDYDPDNE